eukprot:GILJ01004222.1.p1 GENE.GILJ01004222.1~~GILJ01004222.1.p1  ORF type:complete len:347 (+),score=52.11 GILJ01004222.1:60-1100(+)
MSLRGGTASRQRALWTRKNERISNSLPMTFSLMSKDSDTKEPLPPIKLRTQHETTTTTTTQQHKPYTRRAPTSFRFFADSASAPQTARNMTEKQQEAAEVPDVFDLPTSRTEPFVTPFLTEPNLEELLEHRMTVNRMGVSQRITNLREERLLQPLKPSERKERLREAYAKDYMASRNRWLKSRGQFNQVELSKQQKILMRLWFDSLDTDGSGNIGLDELEEPLISVGVARDREEVAELMAAVDGDGSGEITFDEFMDLFKTTRNDLYWDRKQKVLQLFKLVEAGSLGDKRLPLGLLIYSYRRKMLMAALKMSENDHEQAEGKIVMLALERMMIRRDKDRSQQPSKP